MTQNPMNICSDFHLDRHFSGLAMNAFVGNLVTLQPNKTRYFRENVVYNIKL